MGTGTIVGYVVLFVFLLLLIAAHPGFILLLLFVIIIMLARDIKKRRKQKISLSRTYPRDYPKQVDPDDEYRKKRDASRAKMGFSPLKKEPKKDKSAIPIPNDKKNYARIIPGDEQTDKKNDEINSHEILKENIRLDSIQNAFEKNYKEIIEKKSFNQNYWVFKYNEHIESKKRKFFEAMDFCETNNLGSKAKIRRLRMKMDRWNVENERDMEAIMSDYDYLLSLIEEFETK